MANETATRNKVSTSNNSLWQNFHFSGKVIMCSVLFGLGLILIGGLVMAIGIDNNDDKPVNNFEEVPTKAPMSFVGPVIMGIGGFTVFIGIIMCLIETKVCRKRTPDSRPLISDRQGNLEAVESLPAAMPSTSHNNNHRQGARRKTPSPKRSKGISKKAHAHKEKYSQEIPSHKFSPSASTDTNNSKSYLSASDKFLTPPSSLKENTIVLQSNSRDAENQTSYALMKSFTSSGPSWAASTEFQTPATSFKDTSTSLESSVQTDDLLSSASTLNNNQTPENLENMNAGFSTPIASAIGKDLTLPVGTQPQDSAEIETQVVNCGASRVKISTVAAVVEEDITLPSNTQLLNLVEIEPPLLPQVTNTVSSPDEISTIASMAGSDITLPVNIKSQNSVEIEPSSLSRVINSATSSVDVYTITSVLDKYTTLPFNTQPQNSAEIINSVEPPAPSRAIAENESGWNERFDRNISTNSNSQTNIPEENTAQSLDAGNEAHILNICPNSPKSETEENVPQPKEKNSACNETNSGALVNQSVVTEPSNSNIDDVFSHNREGSDKSEVILTAEAK